MRTLFPPLSPPHAPQSRLSTEQIDFKSNLNSLAAPVQAVMGIQSNELQLQQPLAKDEQSPICAAASTPWHYGGL